MKSLMIRIIRYLAKKYYGSKYENIFIKDKERNLFSGEEKRKIKWPQDKAAAFNLQFDDLCGKTKKDNGYDYGGSLQEKINTLMKDFIKHNPQVKLTLFLIPQASFKDHKGIIWKGEQTSKNKISLAQYQELIKWLNQENQIEVACHGFTHAQTDVNYFLVPAEFEFSDSEEAKTKIQKALTVLSEANLKVEGFRAPAWGIGYNSDFGLIKALKEINDFSYVSLSSPLSGLNWDQKRVSNVYPENFEGLLNLPQNVSINWSIERIKETVDKIIEYNGIVTLMGHYKENSEFVSDGISQENLDKIRTVLDYLSMEYKNEIWYAHLREITHYWKENYGKKKKV